MSGLLENRVIVVIGGTTGIGISAARAFLTEGARLVVMGRDKAHLEEALANLGPDVRGVPGDASVSGSAETAIQKGIDEFGGFHGLYHVAGGSGRRMGDGPLHEISDEGLNYTLDLNLKSVFYSNRAAVRQFLSQNTGGTVLNMSSVLGFSPAPKHFATHVYSAAKAAIIGLTKSAASYYAGRNIRFNVVAPALVVTPMAQRAVNDPEIMRYIQTKQPLDGGRAGLAADVDAAAVFFMSDQSKFVTGQVLAVDGGWSVSEGKTG
jgi:NAD(P)-dependent dehydrogenase (short-subunit alcohol dehydrogenase family)